MMRQVRKLDRHGQRSRQILKKGSAWAFLWVAAVCVLCCGCGRKGGAILIGGAGNQPEESASSGNDAGGGSLAGMSDSGTGAAPAGTTASGSAAAGISGAGSPGDSPEAVLIRVYVCGAVASPGVVEIPAGSRAEDALLAAGGFAAEAAREAVNLADWVQDGQKLYIPTQGEGPVPEEMPDGGTEVSSGLVNINTADAAALCTLSGVGESRAADIIAYREANGGFESCEDIMKVPGIKNAMYEKIKDKITVK